MVDALRAVLEVEVRAGEDGLVLRAAPKDPVARCIVAVELVSTALLELDHAAVIVPGQDFLRVGPLLATRDRVAGRIVREDERADLRRKMRPSRRVRV